MHSDNASSLYWADTALMLLRRTDTMPVCRQCPLVSTQQLCGSPPVFDDRQHDTLLSSLQGFARTFHALLGHGCDNPAGVGLGSNLVCPRCVSRNEHWVQTGFSFERKKEMLVASLSGTAGAALGTIGRFPLWPPRQRSLQAWRWSRQHLRGRPRRPNCPRSRCRCLPSSRMRRACMV